MQLNTKLDTFRAMKGARLVLLGVAGLGIARQILYLVDGFSETATDVEELREEIRARDDVDERTLTIIAELRRRHEQLRGACFLAGLVPLEETIVEETIEAPEEELST